MINSITAKKIINIIHFHLENHDIPSQSCSSKRMVCLDWSFANTYFIKHTLLNS